MNARAHPRTASGIFNRWPLPAVLCRGWRRGLTVSAAFSICRHWEAVSSQLDHAEDLSPASAEVEAVDILWGPSSTHGRAGGRE